MQVDRKMCQNNQYVCCWHHNFDCTAGSGLEKGAGSGGFFVIGGEERRYLGTDCKRDRIR